MNARKKTIITAITPMICIVSCFLVFFFVGSSFGGVSFFSFVGLLFFFIVFFSFFILSYLEYFLKEFVGSFYWVSGYIYAVVLLIYISC